VGRRRRQGAAAVVKAAQGRRAVDRDPLGKNALVIGVWMMQPGEDKIVAKRLRQLLDKQA
jgi:hypothetical protein